MLDSSQIDIIFKKLVQSPEVRDLTHFHFYSLEKLDEKLEFVKSVFPNHWDHAVAIKSNPLQQILLRISESKQGLEAASTNEVLMAINSDCPLIIWDSPIKTIHDIECVIKQKKEHQKIYVNANSLDELEALSKYQKDFILGLRLNLTTSQSTNLAYNVSTSLSKFGEPILELSDKLDRIKGFISRIGLHIHASSQNTNLHEKVRDIRLLLDIKANFEANGIEVSHLNIGGGIGVDYAIDNTALIKEFADKLLITCPELSDPNLKVQTEFGRFYHAYCGFAASRIHEVKRQNQHQVIIQHFGAETFLRECYQPDIWNHRFFAVSKETNKPSNYISDIAGPLCFGGDYLARKIESLPKVDVGDWLIIADTGANSYALQSFHCSLPLAPVFTLTNDTVSCLKKGQTFEEVQYLWS